METSSRLCSVCRWTYRLVCGLLREYSCPTKSSKLKLSDLSFFSRFCIDRSLDMFIEQSFYQEALELTRHYKPILEKLGEPIEPLQVDPTSRFNYLASQAAQVSRLISIVDLFLSIDRL